MQSDLFNDEDFTPAPTQGPEIIAWIQQANPTFLFIVATTHRCKLGICSLSWKARSPGAKIRYASLADCFQYPAYRPGLVILAPTMAIPG